MLVIIFIDGSSIFFEDITKWAIEDGFAIVTIKEKTGMFNLKSIKSISDCFNDEYGDKL